MTRKDLLQGIRRAEEKADGILRDAEARQERMKAETEGERSEIFSDAQARTDAEIEKMESDIERQLEGLREDGREAGKERASAMRSAAARRMPELVDELVAEFRKKVAP